MDLQTVHGVGGGYYFVFVPNALLDLIERGIFCFYLSVCPSVRPSIFQSV